MVPGEGPAEASSGCRRWLEVVPTPLGGGDSRMRRWLILQVDILGCELDGVGVFVYHHEKVQVLVRLATLIASPGLSLNLHLLCNILTECLSKLLGGDFHVLTARLDKERPLLPGRVLLMVDVPMRVTPLLGVLRGGLEVIPLVRHVGRVQEAGSHRLRFLDAMGVACGRHLLI